jgi:cyanophycin synthetase
MHGAAVTGDGEKTIAELVEIKNRDPLRAPKSGVHRQSELDEEILDTMLNDGHTPESVPPAGERVRLSSTGNTSRGGTWEDVHDVHPDVAEIVLLAQRVLKLDISGVDFILPDVSKSWKGTGGGICEVNPMPGMWGVPHATDRLFEYLFPPDKTACIPLAAILGSETGSRTARLLADVLQGAGRTVGLASADGCRVNHSVIDEQDAADARFALQIQRDPRIDAAVLQTGSEQVFAQGFGFDACDVAAITDPINEMGEIEKLLAEVTTGTIILDADDPRCPELMSFEKMPRVCLISQNAANETVARHIETGGDAVRLELDGEDTWIVIHHSGESMRLFPSRDLPDAPDETALRAAMMAAAMGTALDVEADALKSMLLSQPGPA